MAYRSHNLRVVLGELGFSAKEARVYLALLELGRGTVSDIARKAGINRTTGYDILNTLVNKGLVIISGKEPKQEYTAPSPDKILVNLQDELDEGKSKIEAAKRLIPQLKSRHNVHGRPQVRFYEGKEGLVQAYEDTLSASETIRAYANIDDMHKALPGYFPRYYKRRVEKGIKIRAIFPTTTGGRMRVERDTQEKRESALIPEDPFYFSPEINIYDNKVMIASWKEELGIIIESQEIADAMKKIYELSWAEAKRYDAREKGRAGGTVQKAWG